MSYWNYRIIRKTYKTESYTEDEYGVYEVYYDKDGKVTAWTKDPIRITSETSEGIEWVIDKIKEAMKKETLILEELEEAAKQKKVLENK